MQLVHLPALRRRSLETLSHTGLSVAHLLFRRADATIVFNAANAPWLPLLRLARIPVATHMDGLNGSGPSGGPSGNGTTAGQRDFPSGFPMPLLQMQPGFVTTTAPPSMPPPS